MIFLLKNILLQTDADQYSSTDETVTTLFSESDIGLFYLKCLKRYYHINYLLKYPIFKNVFIK